MTDLSNLPLIRTSERACLERCWWRWHWTYERALGSAHKPPALRFGLLIHKALEEYYIPGRDRGLHPVSTFIELHDEERERLQYEYGQWDEDEWIEAEKLGVDMLERYVEYWREEDKLWEVIAPEVPAKVLVRDEDGTPLAWYLMQFDLVIFHHGHGRYYFVDHKTTGSSIPSSEELSMDEQNGAYWTFGPAWLAENGYIPENITISGFLYNYLRKSMGDTRPQNEKGQYLNKPKKAAIKKRCEELGLEVSGSLKADYYQALEESGEDPDLLGEVSKNQPAPYFERFPVYRDEADRRNVLYRVRSHIKIMNMLREGELPIVKDPRMIGIHSCTRCPVFEMCAAHESGNDWEGIKDMMMIEIDPYEQYRGMGLGIGPGPREEG